MTHRILWSQLRIGVLATIGLLVGSVAIFFIDEVRDALEDRYTLYFLTFTTQTLRPRAPVWLAGQPVGHVRRVAFRPPTSQTSEDRLRVDLSIRVEVKPHITEGATAQVVTAGRLGEAVVNILPAREAGASLPEGSELPTAPQLNIGDLTRRLREAADSLEPTAQRWRTLLRLAREGGGTLARLRRDPETLLRLQRDLERVVATIDTLSGAADELSGVFTEPRVRAALRRSSQGIPELRAALRDGNGSLARFAADSLLADRLERTADRLARLADRLERGEGTLGRLLNDRALAQEWMETTQALRELRRDLGNIFGDRGLTAR